MCLIIGKTLSDINPLQACNESLLTIQQQLERLQREVSDISKSIYSNSDNLENNIDSNVVSNLSASII